MTSDAGLLAVRSPLPVSADTPAPALPTDPDALADEFSNHLQWAGQREPSPGGNAATPAPVDPASPPPTTVASSSPLLRLRRPAKAPASPHAAESPQSRPLPRIRSARDSTLAAPIDASPATYPAIVAAPLIPLPSAQPETPQREAGYVTSPQPTPATAPFHRPPLPGGPQPTQAAQPFTRATQPVAAHPGTALTTAALPTVPSVASPVLARSVQVSRPTPEPGEAYLPLDSSSHDTSPVTPGPAPSPMPLRDEPARARSAAARPPAPNPGTVQLAPGPDRTISPAHLTDPSALHPHQRVAAPVAAAGIPDAIESILRTPFATAAAETPALRGMEPSGETSPHPEGPQQTPSPVATHPRSDARPTEPDSDQPPAGILDWAPEITDSTATSTRLPTFPSFATAARLPHRVESSRELGPLPLPPETLATAVPPPPLTTEPRSSSPRPAHADPVVSPGTESGPGPQPRREETRLATSTPWTRDGTMPTDLPETGFRESPIIPIANSPPEDTPRLVPGPPFITNNSALIGPTAENRQPGISVPHAAGILVASQGVDMNNRPPTEESAGLAAKELPSRSDLPRAQSRLGIDREGPGVEFHHLPAGMGLFQPEPLQLIQPAFTTAETPVASAPRLAEPALIDQVASAIDRSLTQLRHSDSDSLSVVLRPDSHTELHLRIEVQDGAVHAELQVERGDSALLAPHWEDLDRRLADQGVRLVRNPDSTGTEFLPGDSRRQPAPQDPDADALFAAAPLSKRVPSRSLNATKTPGFEFWA